MGMGFVMGMFVGGSVTLLHAAMSGGLKGINGMAVKRSDLGDTEEACRRMRCRALRRSDSTRAHS